MPEIWQADGQQLKHGESWRTKMNIEKLKEMHDLYEKYENKKRAVTVCCEKIDEIKRDMELLIGERNDVFDEISILEYDGNSDNIDPDDEVEMGSPLHRKLEAMLTENRIDRGDFKEYLNITSMRYITVGQALRFINDPRVYRDAIYGGRE